jgi:hypothetical protein
MRRRPTGCQLTIEGGFLLKREFAITSAPQGNFVLPLAGFFVSI